jgi:hypothetical protein
MPYRCEERHHIIIHCAGVGFGDVGAPEDLLSHLETLESCERKCELQKRRLVHVQSRFRRQLVLRISQELTEGSAGVPLLAWAGARKVSSPAFAIYTSSCCHHFSHLCNA